jgi:hypothetical protein
MIVQLEDGTISLEGSCPVDDSATLHEYLGESPQATVDWSKCDWMHTAVFQILLAVRPPMRGTLPATLSGCTSSRCWRKRTLSDVWDGGSKIVSAVSRRFLPTEKTMTHTF